MWNCLSFWLGAPKSCQGTDISVPMLEMTFLPRLHAVSHVQRESIHRKYVDGNGSLLKHFLYFKPNTNIKQHEPLLCALEGLRNPPWGAHTQEGLWFGHQNCCQHLMGLTSFGHSAAFTRFLTQTSVEKGIPYSWLLPNRLLCLLDCLKIWCFVICRISGYLWDSSSDHPACSCPLPLLSSSCPGALLSSLPYTAGQAVSLQRASIHTVLVGWLHSRTWVDRYKRPSLGTKCCRGMASTQSLSRVIIRQGW